MNEFLTNNKAFIPFTIATVCNLWVAIDLLIEKRSIPLAVAYFAYAVASAAMFWHYYNLDATNAN